MPATVTPRGSDEAEVWGALVLGLRDYIRKNGFRSVVLGLSGGIDSAVVAAMAVDALGADRVHCVMLPYAYTSRVGLGGGTFHVGGKAGPSDSVYLGVFRRDLLLEVGMFDERMIRGQDWQLNLRFREAGYTVWFDPRLEVTYYPRSSVGRLAKQFYDTGIWRALITKMSPTKANLRYFAPPLLVIATLLGFPFGIYMVAIAAVAFSAEGLDNKTRLNLLIALPVMHYCWGAGFIRGLFAKPIKNEARG